MSILDKLKAAGVVGRRKSSAIRAEIAAVETVLKRLRAEHMASCSSERMLKMQQDPEFRRKRREGQMRSEARPEIRAMRRAVILATGQPQRLPPMTAEQKRQYGKLKYVCGQSRQDALRAVLG